ncbi:LLM class flavin-dependent oxidoreductase [Kribbella sp. NPDC051770]|uniref:LLM class flavin-dependent oxidoreductase n=1 Tax=Kribbella sp. NPDC051770 TaxID=3155413 RepID=UPI003442B342
MTVTSDDHRLNRLVFGVAVSPERAPERLRAVAAAADQGGLDLVGVQDLPFVASNLDALAVIADLIPRTEHVHFFPDVANLPLRPAPMLARAASSLSTLSGGRFQLGLGAGGLWDGIASMGVERRTAAQALAAQEEAIALMRQLWHDDASVTSPGPWYPVEGMAGQAPDPAGVEIWLGAMGPRSLELTGRVADGWAAPIAPYFPYERWTEGHRTIDRSAIAAGRKPSEVRRIAQLVGTITPDAGSSTLRGSEPIRTDVQGWVDVITRLAEEGSFNGFVMMPEGDTVEQTRRYAEEVAAGVRARFLA